MTKVKPILIYSSVLFVLIIFQNNKVLAQSQQVDSAEYVRMEEFQKMVNRDKAKALHWWYGWIGGYSAATVGQGIVYLSTSEKTTRQDMALGAATTFLGALGTLLTPLVPGSSSLKDHSIQPNDSIPGYIDKEYYESLLKELAEREKAGRSWKVHAVTGAVNIASGLITWLGFKRTIGAGLANFAINTVITETQIWTQPVKAIRDYENYSRNNNTTSPPPNLKETKSKMFLSIYPGGFALRLNF